MKNKPHQATAAQTSAPHSKHDIRPGQSLELLKELHILTRDGQLNQDSRRKLKQVYHLFQFIEPLLTDVLARDGAVRLRIAAHTDQAETVAKTHAGKLCADAAAACAGELHRDLAVPAGRDGRGAGQRL